MSPNAKSLSSTGWGLTGLSLAMLMPSLATSIANAALPVLAQAFSASFQAAQWIVLTYLLAVTTVIVAVGRLGDLIGRRRLLLAGILLFTGSSLLCGLAPTLWLLLLARVAQGLGAATMMALTVAFVGDVIPREGAGRAMGLLGTMSAIGTALGPSLGGMLIALLGWQAIFLVHVPMGVIAFALVFRTLPADGRSTKAGRVSFDGIGMALLFLTLAAYALSMTICRGHFELLNGGLLMTAIVAGVIFLVVEARTESPLVPMQLFRNPVLSSNLAASSLVATVMMASLVVGPFYLSQALKLNAAMVGITLSAGPLVAAVAGVPAGRLVDRFGASRMGIAGLAGMIVGSSALDLIPTPAGIAGYVFPVVFLTGGYAMFQAANNTEIMEQAVPAQRGVISGMLNLSRNLGLITGAAAMGAVFALGTGSNDVATAPPEAIAAGMRAAFRVASILILVALAITVRRQHICAPGTPAATSA